MGNDEPEVKQKSPRSSKELTSLSIPITENNASLPIRSWTRLGLGIVLLGLDALLVRTRTWEQKVEHSYPTTSSRQQEHIAPPLNTQESETASVSHLESHHQRQALVGFMFDGQDHLFRGITTIRRLEGLANRLLSPVVSPIVNGRLFQLVKSRFDKIVSRGQEQVNFWVQIGMAEESHSRELLKAATITTVDTSIDYLSSNPDVKELVQSQSTNLINEIIEEIRERTVSGDTLVEGFIRAAFHLTPRHNLPEPPLEVRMRAIRIRPPKMDKLIEDKW